jgi:Uma2 family endonuclease
MAITTTPLISVEEYLRRTEKPNAEYEDGILYPKPLATTAHAYIQTESVRLLREQGAIALTELTLPLSSTRFLVPDVTVVRRMERPYPTEPAILCIEILSPEQHLGEMLAKCEKYHDWGVPYCWVIDPDKKTAWEYHSGGEPVKMDPNGALRAGELAVALPELFSGLN